MIESLTGTFDGNSLVPDRHIDLPAGARVLITVEKLEPSAEQDAHQAISPSAIDEFDALCEERPIYAPNRMTRDELHDRGRY